MYVHQFYNMNMQPNYSLYNFFDIAMYIKCNQKFLLHYPTRDLQRTLGLIKQEVNQISVASPSPVNQ